MKLGWMFPWSSGHSLVRQKLQEDIFPIHGGSTAPQTSGFPVHLPIYFYVYLWQKPESWGENNKANATIIIIIITPPHTGEHWGLFKHFPINSPIQKTHYITDFYNFLLSSNYYSNYFLFSSNLLLWFLLPTHFALSIITERTMESTSELDLDQGILNFLK